MLNQKNLGIEELFSCYSKYSLMNYKQLIIAIVTLKNKIDTISDEQCKYKSKRLWKLNVAGKYIREQRLTYLRKKRDELYSYIPLIGMTEATGKIDKSKQKMFKIALDGDANKQSTKYIWNVIKELSIKYPDSKFIKDASLLYYPDAMFAYDADYSSTYLRNYIIDASIQNELDYSMYLFKKKHIETLIITEDRWLNKAYILKETEFIKLKQNIKRNIFDIKLDN